MGNPKDDPLSGKMLGPSTLQIIGQPIFNEELENSLFVIDIQFGYQVNDQIRNIVYAKGSTDPDRFVAELVKDSRTGLAKLPQNERRLPQTVFLPESWWFRNRVWLAWSSAVLLLVIAALSVRRYRRSQGVA